MLNPLFLHKLIVGFFAALARYSVRHPRRVILVAVALTLAVTPGAMRLKLRTDGHALVDGDAPEVALDQRAREHFGLQDPVVVLVKSAHADGIFNPATLQLVREMTVKLGRIEGVNTNKIVSLANQRGFRNRPGTLHFRTFLETPRATKAECDELRSDLARIQLYTGTMVSYDGRMTAILVGAPPGKDRTVLYREVQNIVAPHQDATNEIAITGPPVAEALLGTHILEDLGVPKPLLGVSTHEGTARPGWPHNLFELRAFVARHIGLVPVAMVIMALVFQFAFRRIVATVLPMAEVGACLMFIFGLMGWCGVPVYLTIAVMPVLLTAMAVTDEIHVYSRYFALLHERPRTPRAELIAMAMEEMICPVVNTSLTTAIGFVSFAFSPLGPVQAFGIFTAIGVMFCLFWSVSVLPALLVLVPEQWVKTRRRAAERPGSGRAFGAFAQWAVRRRWWVMGAVALLVAATPLGLKQLQIQDSWIDGFEPESDFSRATRLVNEQFHGMHLLYVTLDAEEKISGTLPRADVAYARFKFPTNVVSDPRTLPGRWLSVSAGGVAWRALIESAQVQTGRLVVVTQQREQESPFWTNIAQADGARFEIMAQPFLDNAVLRRVADFCAYIETHKDCKVGRVLGPADYVATTRFMVRPNEPGSRLVPTNKAEIKLMWDYYRIARGEDQLRQAVDTNHAQALVTVFLKEANFIDTARLMKDVRAYSREHLAPHGIRADFAGDVAVSQSLIRGIVSTQTQSLLGSLLGIWLVTALLGRSWRWGLFAVLPCAISVLVNFAVMGWAGIPLGVATSMFAAMTLGNGVDFAIHVLEGFDAARREGQEVDDAIATSLARTGPAVFVNTVAIALGFGVLILSQVPANARLGALIILGIVNCLVVSMFLLPALLRWWPGRNAAAAVKS